MHVHLRMCVHRYMCIFCLYQELYTQIFAQVDTQFETRNSGRTCLEYVVLSSYKYTGHFPHVYTLELSLHVV